MAPPRPSDAYVAKKPSARSSPAALPLASSSQATADLPNTDTSASDVVESLTKAPKEDQSTTQRVIDADIARRQKYEERRNQIDDAEEAPAESANSESAPSDAVESLKKARKTKKFVVKDILEDDSSEEEESVAASEHQQALPVSISHLQAMRVGTSLSSSHFHGATHRNKLTGKISMHEDRYMPNFSLVDLFGRRALVMTPEEMVQDEYLFRFEAMPIRTWLFHDLVLDPAAMAKSQISGSSSSMVSSVLKRRVIDAPVNTGLRSPLLFWLPMIFLMGMTGDQTLVGFSLVSTALLYMVTHLNNTPKRYMELRWRSLPLRLLSAAIFFWRYFADPENQEIMPMVCILSSIALIALDFITGDMRMLANFRLLCTYTIIDELPHRVFVCRRHGAAHLEDVVGKREPISNAISGTSRWKSDMSLIADLNGLLVELRRPTLREAEMMHEEYQDRCVDQGFLSLPTYTRERPCFRALDPLLHEDELQEIIEKNKEEHPLTWRCSSPEDNPPPEK